MKVTCQVCMGEGINNRMPDRTPTKCPACFGSGITTAPTGTESRVCADIAARQAKGIAKYGTTVQDNPLALREWLQHAYEECLYQAVYLKRAMEEMDKEPR